jgi:ATP-binding cassette subfamily C (CFTR/MRP) protein 4
MVKLVQPLFISRMMTYFDGTGTLNTALIYGGLICLGATFNAVIHHPYFLHIAKLGVKMRLACSGLVYKKVRCFIYLISFNFNTKKLKIKRFQN